MRIESTIFDLSQVIRGFHPKKISDKDFKYPSVSLSNDKEKQENIGTTIKLVKLLEQFLNLPLNFFENLEEREIDLSSNRVWSSNFKVWASSPESFKISLE